MSASHEQEPAAYNLVLAIYGISKVAACREFLSSPPVNMDRVLNRLAAFDNPKIRANANRAFKNLNADMNEAIEEGAVASLIAMSLEVSAAIKCMILYQFINGVIGLFID